MSKHGAEPPIYVSRFTCLARNSDFAEPVGLLDDLAQAVEKGRRVRAVDGAVVEGLRAARFNGGVRAGGKRRARQFVFAFKVICAYATTNASKLELSHEKSWRAISQP
jgi:hypothetical protein